MKKRCAVLKILRHEKALIGVLEEKGWGLANKRGGGLKRQRSGGSRGVLGEKCGRGVKEVEVGPHERRLRSGLDVTRGTHSLLE